MDWAVQDGKLQCGMLRISWVISWNGVIGYLRSYVRTGELLLYWTESFFLLPTGCTSSRGMWPQLSLLMMWTLCFSSAPRRNPTSLWSGEFQCLNQETHHKVNNDGYLTSEACGLGLLTSVMLLLFRLQEVKAAPLKFVTDLAFEDSWSHLFMNTLAPLGYIKVLTHTNMLLFIIILIMWYSLWISGLYHWFLNQWFIEQL